MPVSDRELDLDLERREALEADELRECSAREEDLLRPDREELRDRCFPS